MPFNYEFRHGICHSEAASALNVGTPSSMVDSEREAFVDGAGEKRKEQFSHRGNIPCIDHHI
jgi:hypothetical protein